jgi:arylsulfatase A-like enzyme
MAFRLSVTDVVRHVVASLAAWLAIAATNSSAAANAPSSLAGLRPNVVFIITDDQGYGELACHGNPLIKTPNLDRLYAESVRFTAFHVSPTCAPTRAALLTGRHEFRSGVTHTIMQRERLALHAVTFSELLVQSGYETGIFGKWHLGDEAPYRPARRGFTESFIHGAGGIGQSYPGSCGDFPNNTYYDPLVLHNEKVVKTRGYCTDVFFDQAASWIEQSRSRPFFALIATNAPHAPLICPPEYQKPYEEAGLDEKTAAYYGMITNIDDNVGQLLARLEELRLTERTLVVFMTDNGHSLARAYNAEMRGKKGTPHEGGTRVPAFFRWPGMLTAGVDVPALAAHIDILPTLTEICGAKVPPNVQLDGRSLTPLLQNSNAEWPDRYLITHVGRWEQGQVAGAKLTNCAVRSQQFRLVNNHELYDIANDPGERYNVIDQFPEVVAQMRAAYDRWWDEVQPCLVNENVAFAAENAFAALYQEQVADEADE